MRHAPPPPQPSQACHWLIDELKATVPIWKKEFFEGGEVWKENEEWRQQQRRQVGQPQQEQEQQQEQQGASSEGKEAVAAGSAEEAVLKGEV